MERLPSAVAIHRARLDGRQLVSRPLGNTAPLEPQREAMERGCKPRVIGNLAPRNNAGTGFVHTFDEARGLKYRFLYTRGADRRWEPKLPRQPNTMKRVDAEPVDIKLIPCEAVSDTAWIGMVVVMPALAKRQ